MINRPETESYTSHLAQLILSRYQKRQRQHQPHQPPWPLPLQSPDSDPSATTQASSLPPLRILDLCTGTGCIPLLVHSLLAPHIANLQILGVDISPRAIALARKNLAHNIAKKTLSPVAETQIRFVRGDVLRAGSGSKASVDDTRRESGPVSHHDGRRRRKAGDGNREGNEYLSEDWHVVTCNPPYISQRAFNTCTARSVRNFEPRLALVPPSVSRLHAESDEADSCARSPSATSTPTPSKGQDERERCDNDDNGGDAFYPSVLAIAKRVKARVLVMEVGDMAQAERVAGLACALSSAEEGGGKEWEEVVIWRDWIDQRPFVADAGVGKEGRSVPGRDGGMRGVGQAGGEGNGRVVVCSQGCGVDR